jgi:hypothetical protein
MMRRLLAAALASGLLPCVLLSARQDRSAEILARAREAIGGQARLQAVKSLSLKASTRRIGPGIVFREGSATPRGLQETRIDVSVEILLPDKFRLTRSGAWSPRVSGFNGTRLIGEMSGSPAAVERMLAIGPRASSPWHREFLRFMLAWLLTAPEPYGVQFSDGGVAEIAGEQANVIEATGEDQFAARLCFDEQARLLMLTYQEPPPPARPMAAARQEAKPLEKGGGLFTSIERPLEQLNIQLRLTDYRADDGIVFPHLMSTESGGKLLEQWKISRFKVNPPLDPKHFEPR